METINENIRICRAEVSWQGSNYENLKSVCYRMVEINDLEDEPFEYYDSHIFLEWWYDEEFNLINGDNLEIYESSVDEEFFEVNEISKLIENDLLRFGDKMKSVLNIETILSEIKEIGRASCREIV